MPLIRLGIFKPLAHGGATWSSAVSRDQVGDGANIMGKVVPQVITLLMDHPHEDWGKPNYPVVE